MNWIGRWQNQYGSILEITDDTDHRIVGSFKTALADSGFAAQAVPVFGFHRGDCMGCSGGGRSPAGDMVVSYTGLYRDGKLETLWHLVADAALTAGAAGEAATPKKVPWWRAISTNSDTFVRID